MRFEVVNTSVLALMHTRVSILSHYNQRRNHHTQLQKYYLICFHYCRLTVRQCDAVGLHVGSTVCSVFVCAGLSATASSCFNVCGKVVEESTLLLEIS